MLKVYPSYESEALARPYNNLSNPHKLCDAGTVLQNTSSSFKARVFITTMNQKCVVVKDYSASHPIIRATLCHWLIQREVAAMKRLQGHPGVPQVVGLYGQFGFAIELVEGKTLDNALLKGNASLMHKIDQTISTMHRYGVSHNDIRNKNLMLDRNDNLYIVDFASAVIRPKRGFSFLTLLFNLSRFSDRVKIVRLKQEFSSQTLLTKDRQLLKFVSSSRRLSRLWKNYVYKFIKFRWLP